MDVPQLGFGGQARQIFEVARMLCNLVIGLLETQFPRPKYAVDGVLQARGLVEFDRFDQEPQDQSVYPGHGRQKRLGGIQKEGQLSGRQEE